MAFDKLNIIRASNIAISELARTYNVQTARTLKVVKNDFDGKIDKTDFTDKELYKSTLGTPVFSDLTFKGATYTDNRGRQVTFNDFVIPLVLMNVSLPKRNIKTDIQGSDGTSKEYIGQDDYQITINGIIAGPNGHYPIDEVNALHQVAKANIPIEVISTYLQNLDIFNIVIEDISYDQEPGGYSKQNFTITAISDMPIELLILD